jgi:hypothetical protein
MDTQRFIGFIFTILEALTIENNKLLHRSPSDYCEILIKMNGILSVSFKTQIYEYIHINCLKQQYTKTYISIYQR